MTMGNRESSPECKTQFNQCLIDAIPLPVCMQDRQGGFLGVNTAFTEFFFLDKELPPDFDLNTLLNSEASEKNRDLETAVLSDGKTKSFEALLQCSPVIERDVIFNKTAVVDTDGEIAGLLTTLEDITTQRRVEQQLRHAQKMEAIGTLAGGIAHDFNNVLTPIIGYAEIMRITISRKGDDKDSLLQFVGEILAAAKRAKSLVEQILTFSRSREQKVLPQYLSPIVKEVLKLIRVTLPTSIKISHDIDEECGLVTIDPVQFHQVLLNLCTNSAQSIGDAHGELTVSLQKAATDVNGQEWLELRVSDSGEGIPEELQERVFEPYFTTKEKAHGTGMGLAMVHGIVTRCGGRIELKSSKGQGAAFHLYFPCTKLEQEVEKSSTHNVALAGNERVMVVDDQDAVLKITKKILNTLGYTVKIFSSSRDALDVFSSDPKAFDLIVTDYAMPALTGKELCREVKKRREDIPVILCTGYGEKFSDSELRQAGFDAWLTKPVALQKLASTVRAVLDT